MAFISFCIGIFQYINKNYLEAFLSLIYLSVFSLGAVIVFKKNYRVICEEEHYEKKRQ